jgi:hypothetical protein
MRTASPALVSQPKPVSRFFFAEPLKDQSMSKNRFNLHISRFTSGILLALLFFSARSYALSLDDVQFWTGNGTNRAALVIHWSAPEVRNNTTVPNPAAEKSLVWGYRWNGTNTAEDMFNTIVAADHRLFVAASTPFAGFGPFIYALGYDLNNNGVFGIRTGTNVFAENSFTNGQRIFSTEDSDAAQSLDAGDLFWSGLDGANWEMWQEQSGTGGFTNSPDRGTNPYWTPTDTTFFSTGFHGQWDLASGMETVTLKDGSWIGFTVSAGGLNFNDNNDPGTVAYDFHKHAPVPPEPAATNSTYAFQMVAAQGPFGPSPYNDPNSALGAPATRFYTSASAPATRAKLNEAVFNYSVVNGVTNKLITTLNTGSSIIVKFDHPISDNPANPYGIDFEVFGNTFYAASAFGDAANMNTVTLGTGAFAEPMKVSVSPGYTAKPGEDPNDSTTWPWYRYDNGPYADSVFPTQAYRWNRAGASWTDELMDFTKPVNPVLTNRFTAGGLSGADGIDLYNGSGGGTGFDLKASGFASVQYVKVEGLSGFTGGEIDAVSVVRPMTIGDTLSIAPANIGTSGAKLCFQKPGAENQTAVSLNFTSVADIAAVSTARLGDSIALATLPGTAVNALQINISPVLGAGPVAFQTDVALAPSGDYNGNGHDLRVLAWNGTNWTSQPFTFTNNTAVLAGVTNFSPLALAQFTAPTLALHAGTNSFTFQLTPVANCSQTLERSTNLVTWIPVTTITPTNSAPMTLQDLTAPADKAFYRMRLDIPQ